MGFFVLICSLQAKAQTRCKEISELQKRETERFEQKRRFKEHSEKEFNYDVIYHRFYWEINPAVVYIKGYVTTYFKPRETAFSKIAFDLNTVLHIDSIIYRNQNISFSHESPNTMVADLPVLLQKDILDSISVYYQGIPNSPERSFVQNFNGKTPIIWTLSEPYGARDWWPGKNSLEDKIDSIDIFVRTPKPNKAGSNGILVSSLSVGSDWVYHWKHRYPIAPYLVGIAVTEYAEFTFYAHSTSTDSFPIVNYFYRDDSSALAPRSLRTKEIMEFFISKFGPYPFDKEKYGHAQFNFGGGMEHQTMSFMRNMDIYLIGHELAHQWFGDKITCGSWQDIWLNEGFATFAENIITEAFFSHKEYISWKQSERSAALQPNGAVYVDDTSNSDRIFSSALTYSKGGMVVNMLRFLLGDEKFFLAIKNYLNDPALAYRFARTEDLKRHMEAVYGQNLDWFFNDWIKGKGYPNYSIRYSHLGEKLKIELVQTQSDSESVDFFDMPVPVRIWSNGKDSNLVLHPDKAVQEFEFNIPGFVVDSLEADPEILLVARYNVYNINKITDGKDLFLYPNPAGNILHVEFPDKAIFGGSVAVYDMMGKQLLYIDHVKNGSLDIATNHFSKGVYMLKFIAGDKIYAKKFIKCTDK